MRFFSVLGSILHLLFVVLSFSQQVMAITLPERCISPTSPLRNLTHLSALSTITPINNYNTENHYLTLIIQSSSQGNNHLNTLWTVLTTVMRMRLSLHCLIPGIRPYLWLLKTMNSNNNKSVNLKVNSPSTKLSRSSTILILLVVTFSLFPSSEAAFSKEEKGKGRAEELTPPSTTESLPRSHLLNTNALPFNPSEPGPSHLGAGLSSVHIADDDSVTTISSNENSEKPPPKEITAAKDFNERAHNLIKAYSSRAKWDGSTSTFMSWQGGVNMILQQYGFSLIGTPYQEELLNSLSDTQSASLLAFLSSTLEAGAQRQADVSNDPTSPASENLKRLISTLVGGLSSSSSANRYRLRRELQDATMERSENIDAYYNRLRGIAAALHSVGERVSTSHLLDLLLEGLPSTFESTVEAIKSNMDNMSREQILERLRSKYLDTQRHDHTRNPDTKKEDRRIGRAKVASTAKATNDKPPRIFCKHCNRDHVGGFELCWQRNPNLAPPHIRARITNKSNSHQESSSKNVNQASHKKAAAEDSDSDSDSDLDENCTYCNRGGHLANACRVNPDSDEFRICSNCHRAGHLKDDCKQPPRNNNDKKGQGGSGRRPSRRF